MCRRRHNHDLRLTFADEIVLLACRRALTIMGNDLRRLGPEAIATHVHTRPTNAYQLSLFSSRL